MTYQEAALLYRIERQKRGSAYLPSTWTGNPTASMKTRVPLGNGAYLIHIEPAE